MTRPYPRRPVEERFWEKVKKTEGCWLWNGYRTPQGYGRFALNRTMTPAHRVAFSITKGMIPTKLFVLHKCDNPPCVRPDHLFVGNHNENMEDMRQKGRMRRARGEDNASHKLMPTDVRRIRKMSLSSRKIAAQFGVSHVTVLRILRGKIWTHV